MISFIKNLRFNHFELPILALIAFFLPINQKIIVYLITLLILFSIISWVKYGINRFSKKYWPFILLFLFYVVGLFFTTNFDYGSKDIETRLTFLLFPLFIGLTKREKPINLEVLSVSLLIGCFVNSLLCFYFAFDCFEEVGYVECFQGERLSYNMHPTYFALYIISAGTFFTISQKNKVQPLLRIGLPLLVNLGCLFMVYRLFSLGPWISLVGMLTFLGYAYFHFKQKKVYFLLTLVGLIVCSFIAVKTLPFIERDATLVQQELSEYFADREQYIKENSEDVSSVNARIIIWNTSFDFVKMNPFGVGTGDVKDELMKLYRERGMNAMADRKLNPHCQYLQTAGSIGIFGMLFLIATFAFYIVIGLKKKDFYLIAIVSLFAVACLFESVLERQWGIVFFLFFLSVFIERTTHKIQTT